MSEQLYSKQDVLDKINNIHLIDDISSKLDINNFKIYKIKFTQKTLKYIMERNTLFVIFGIFLTIFVFAATIYFRSGIFK